MKLRIEFRNMMLFYGRSSRMDVIVPDDGGHACVFIQNASGKKVELDGSLIEILKDGKVLTGKVKTDRGEFLIHLKDALGSFLPKPVPRPDTLGWPLPKDVTARVVLGGSATLEAFEAKVPHFPRVPVARWEFKQRSGPPHSQKLTDRVLYTLSVPAKKKDAYAVRVTARNGDEKTFRLAEGTEFSIENRDIPKPDPGRFNVLEEFASLYKLLYIPGTVAMSELPLPTSPDLPSAKPAPVAVVGSPTPGVPMCGSGFVGTEN